MPSKKEVRLFQYYSKCASEIGGFGIDSNSSGLLAPTCSIYKLAAHHCFSGLVIWIFLIRLYKVYVISTSPGSVNIFTQMINIVLFVMDCTVLGLTVCFALFRIEMVNTWNQLLEVSLRGTLNLKPCYLYSKHK